jgi:deazaflavin-dependent oxidoreductase (nitroreductase family)
MMMIRLYARLIRRLGHHRWFSLLVKHALSKLDRSLIRASRGRFSLSGREMATMLLTTKGRRSGKERTTPVYYVRDGPNLVAAYENFGLEVASEWPKSLLANAYARIQIGATVSDSCATCDRRRDRPQHAEARRDVAGARHVSRADGHALRVRLPASWSECLKRSRAAEPSCSKTRCSSSTSTDRGSPKYERAASQRYLTEARRSSRTSQKSQRI